MSRPAHAGALIGLVVVCVAASTASPAGAQQLAVAGIVKTVAGTAFVVRAGQPLPAAPGQPIAEGDLIRTGADGRLGFTLKDGTRLSLGRSTELRVDSFVYAPAQARLGIALRLLQGAAAYVSGRIAQLAPGAVRIETPTSVIGVRGTHLLIEVQQP